MQIWACTLICLQLVRLSFPSRIIGQKLLLCTIPWVGISQVDRRTIPLFHNATAHARGPGGGHQKQCGRGRPVCCCNRAHVV